MTEHEQITRLLEQLGAARAQAETMAAQLLKRADQVAAQRGIRREEALKSLLDLVVKGRAGETPGGTPRSDPAGPAA
jgi:hypothetical protein